MRALVWARPRHALRDHEARIVREIKGVDL